MVHQLITCAMPIVNGQKIAFALRDRIVEAERNVPGSAAPEEHARCALPALWSAIGTLVVWPNQSVSIRAHGSKGSPASGEPTGDGISPDITWDDGYTETPDETASGDYMTGFFR